MFPIVLHLELLLVVSVVNNVDGEFKECLQIQFIVVLIL